VDLIRKICLKKGAISKFEVVSFVYTLINFFDAEIGVLAEIH